MLGISLNLCINMGRTDLIKALTLVIQNQINSFPFIFKSLLFVTKKKYYCLHKVPERFLSVSPYFAVVKDLYFAIISSNWVTPRACI